jgi:hypothetical protein
VSCVAFIARLLFSELFRRLKAQRDLHPIGFRAEAKQRLNATETRPLQGFTKEKMRYLDLVLFTPAIQQLHIVRIVNKKVIQFGTSSLALSFALYLESKINKKLRLKADKKSLLFKKSPFFFTTSNP